MDVYKSGGLSTYQKEKRGTGLNPNQSFLGFWSQPRAAQVQGQDNSFHWEEHTASDSGELWPQPVTNLPALLEGTGEEGTVSMANNTKNEGTEAGGQREMRWQPAPPARGGARRRAGQGARFVGPPAPQLW